MDTISKFVKLGWGGEMEVITCPNGKDEQVDKDAKDEAHADGGEAVARHLHHLLRPDAGDRHQIESQDRNHESIIVSLLDIWHQSIICRHSA